MTHPAEREKAIWTLVAFLGRYGHQSVPEMLNIPTRDLANLAYRISELMEEENRPLQER